MKNNIMKIGLAAAVLALAVPHLAACQSGQQEPENQEIRTGTDASSETVKETMTEEAQTDSTESISATEDSAAPSEDSAALPEETLPAVPQEISEQIAVYVANRGVWMQDDEYEKYSYALHDLDRDGKLELIATTCQGTGLFSDSDFYRLKDGMDGVAEIPQEERLELDIGMGQPDIYRDYGSGEAYFYGTDSVKFGAAQGAVMCGYFRYDGGQIADIAYIGGREWLYEPEKEAEETETWFDGDGITTSYEAWKKQTEAFKEDKILTGDVSFWDRWYMANVDYEFRMSTLSNEEMQEYFENLYMQYQQYIANRDYDTVMERLSAYPADYDAPSQEEQSETWRQFADAVAQGTPAQIVVARPTTEGDPVLTYLDYNGHNIYGIRDGSRDRFLGDGCPYYGFCFTCLKAFEETDEAGKVRQIWALVNREDVTMEELRDAGNQSDFWGTLDYEEIFCLPE